jgi:hypothetical protein
MRYIYIYIYLHHRIFHTVIIKSFWQQYWDCELTFLSQLFFDNGVLKLRWETYNHLRIQSKPYDFRPKICVICLPFLSYTHVLFHMCMNSMNDLCWVSPTSDRVQKCFANVIKHVKLVDDIIFLQLSRESFSI